MGTLAGVHPHDEHRLADAADGKSYEALHAWSVQHREEYWRLAMERLGLSFQRGFDRVMDLSQGVEKPPWLVGARFNIVESCFAAPVDSPAIIYQAEGEPLATMSVGQLKGLATRVAANLRRRGFRPGDTLAILMPMTAESVTIYLWIIKAIPWTQTTPIKCAADAHFHQDVRPGDVLVWPTNLGWMMGPWLVFASLLNRATMGLYNGTPTGTEFGRFVQDAKATMLGVVPSLVRTWRNTGCMRNVDWRSLKVFSSTGECAHPGDMRWLMSLAGGRPVIEYCGGTEIGERAACRQRGSFYCAAVHRLVLHVAQQRPPRNLFCKHTPRSGRRSA
jgi:acyl-coenzyme A synthetase/AMP-(fatty) acid ligase